MSETIKEKTRITEKDDMYDRLIGVQTGNIQTATDCQEAPESLLQKLEHAKKYGYAVEVAYSTGEDEVFTGRVSGQDQAGRWGIDETYWLLPRYITHVEIAYTQSESEPEDIAKQRGERMISKEAGQPDDCIVIENIVKASRNHDIPVKIKMKDSGHFAGVSAEEGIYTSILKDVITIYAGTTATESLLYLRNITGSGSEMHRLINIRHIESISFETEKGFFDNLLE